MKIILAVAVVHLTLLVTGSNVPGERKRVVCYYMGTTVGPYSTLIPEDIDPTICTHLVFLHGAINNDTEEIYLKPLSEEFKSDGEGFVPRLVKLKSVNPELKLILHIADPDYDWISSRRSNIIQNGIKWLNASGFDGFDMPLYFASGEERTADFFCEMKTEFDKYGYVFSTIFMENSFPVPTEGPVDIVSKMARCCDHITLRASTTSAEETHRIAPLSLMKSNLKKYIEKGLPASKALFSVPAVAVIVRIEDPKDTGLGAKIAGPGYDDGIGSGVRIPYKGLWSRLNNSSMEWTIRRDNETLEPYAFTPTGIWTSYEDATSMEYKARYVMENGLGGIATFLLETEDVGDIGNEGRFPLTRAIYNTFNRERHADTNS